MNSVFRNLLNTSANSSINLSNYRLEVSKHMEDPATGHRETIYFCLDANADMAPNLCVATECFS